MPKDRLDRLGDLVEDLFLSLEYYGLHDIQMILNSPISDGEKIQMLKQVEANLVRRIKIHTDTVRNLAFGV